MPHRLLRKESPDRERQQREAPGPEGTRHRRQQDHPPHRRDAAGQGGVRSLHRDRWLRCPRQDRRPPARHRLRRHHDAAPRRLSDLLPHQAQQGLPRHSGDHVVLQGRAVRSCARPDRRLRALSHQAFHQGRAALRDRDSHREMMAMPLILIVDDSPTEVHVMQKALEKHGYRTAAAADGAEGVRLAREMSPDLIFMDIVMPGMNGYQATRALANDPRTRTIPIVMVTSKGQETDKIWGLRQGAIDYMVKPVSPDQLVAKAQATLSA